MTSTATARESQVQQYIRFTEEGPQALLGIAFALAGLHSLVWLAALQDSMIVDAQGIEAVPDKLLTARAGDIAARTTVLRLSKASPLELWLSIAGGATLTGRGMISLFNQYQRARVNKARADWQVTCYEFLKQRFEPYMRTAKISDDQYQEVVQAIEAASAALASIDVIDERTVGQGPGA